MELASSLALWFERDLTRLAQEIEAFSDEAVLWQTPAGITNSAGNLTLHLEGNLREYVGRQLGGAPYARERPKEFSSRGVSRDDLLTRIAAVRHSIPKVIAGLTAAQLERDYPEVVLGRPMSVQQFLLHLYGHLNWHLGQIDYLRRVLTGDGAITLA